MFSVFISGYTSDHGLVGKGVLPPNNTDDVQVGATCVFKTVEWISKFFKGDITAGIAITDYAKTYNLSGQQISEVILTGGVTSDRLSGIVNKYFNTKNPTTFNAAIDAGHPLFGTLINSSGGGHEVMITGYNNNGTIEYFDPEIGKYATKNPVDFTNVIEVTSHKY